MENKILTISIAAYNVEKYIRNTLESLIVPEIFKDIEVLVINDGSTDSTSLIAEEYMKKYSDVFILVNKENAGYGSTINASIKVARGKYFKQLDGDDWFDTENLIDFVEFLKVCDADCIYSPYWEIYEQNGKKQLISAKKPVENRIGVNDIGMWALAFKTKIFVENRIEITEKCFYTDTEYNLKPLFYVSTIKYYNKPIYCYRLGVLGQSVSKEGWKNHYHDCQKVALIMMLYYLNTDAIKNDNKLEIEKYIIKMYRLSFLLALDIYDRTMQREYRRFNIIVKKEFPYFYRKGNCKMFFLVLSQYKLWGAIRIFHVLFEKSIFL